MQLYNLIQSFKADFENLQALKAEVLEATSKQNLQETLAESFDALENHLKEKLAKECAKSLSQARLDFTKNTQTSLENLFVEHIDLVNAAVGAKIDIDKMTQEIAKSLESKHQKQLVKLFSEALQTDVYTREFEKVSQQLTDKITQSANQTKKILEQKHQEIKDIPAQEILQSLAKEFLAEHKQEILRSQNLNFLRDLLKDSKDLQTQAQIAGKEASRHYIAKNAQSLIEEALQTKAKEVFRLFLDDLKEAESLSLLHLQAMSLQSEIAMIDATIARIYAYKRKPTTTEIYHNIHKVI
ncbi:hypothetical protein [Helicobacter sp.]|uniref:hypothetical protein n=1 Tax=Helicobacter sp. TaxID=218 RepID=UPI002A7596A6|nr:hypothetical protein [Helicobacter sp.]MDY2585464.1 hypothetical protein [Helicobacter sp.]